MAVRKLHPGPSRQLQDRTPSAIRLAELRHVAGLTQAELAKQVGIGREFVVRIETGAKRLPKARLAAAAAALGVDLAELEALR